MVHIEVIFGDFLRYAYAFYLFMIALGWIVVIMDDGGDEEEEDEEDA